MVVAIFIAVLTAKILMAYTCTAIVVHGSLFHGLRAWIKPQTPMLIKGQPAKHMVDCRICMTPWVSLAISLMMGDWSLFAFMPVVNIDFLSFFLMWGGATLLAVRER